MEKCTFCQHRIRRKQIKAKQEGRSIKPGEVKTACQQTCPTNAIYFGNAKDKNDKLQALKADARHYTQFESLNYQPAQTYLKKVLHNNRKA